VVNTKIKIEEILSHEMTLLYCQPGNKEKQHLIGSVAAFGIYHNTEYSRPQFQWLSLHNIISNSSYITKDKFISPVHITEKMITEVTTLISPQAVSKGLLNQVHTCKRTHSTNKIPH
jgi:hypothetical protein